MNHHIVEEDIALIVNSIKGKAKMLEGKTILVTGGSGFLGNYFTAVLNELNKSILKKPCKIITIDNYITGSKKGLIDDYDRKNISFIKRDVCKPINVPGPVDYIVHAAGIASPVYYTKFPLETIKVNTLGLQNMLELAKKKKSKSIAYFSSSEIYGDPTSQHVPTPETYKGNVSSIGPRSCYDESKRLGETICMAYWKLFKMPVKIIRPFNVYGPGMKVNDDRVLPKFLSSAFLGKALPIHGNGLQTRTYSYISDAIIGFFLVLLAGKNGQVYNIGNDKGEINLINLAKVIASVFPKKVRFKKIPYPKTYPGDEPTRRCPDVSKAKKELGFNSKINLKDGILRTISWYQDEFYS